MCTALCYLMSLGTIAVPDYRGSLSHLKLKSPLIKKDFKFRRLRAQRPRFPQLCTKPLREVMLMVVVVVWGEEGGEGNFNKLCLLKEGCWSGMENVKCTCLKKKKKLREGWG